LAGGKIGLFWGLVVVGGRWTQGKGEWESEYGGCILCPYMKIEGWNCSKKEEGRERENNGGDRSK
jgi:hypothetical protein